MGRPGVKEGQVSVKKRDIGLQKAESDSARRGHWYRGLNESDFLGGETMPFHKALWRPCLQRNSRIAISMRLGQIRRLPGEIHAGRK